MSARTVRTARTLGGAVLLLLGACAAPQQSLPPPPAPTAPASTPRAPADTPDEAAPHGHRRPTLALRDGQSGAPLPATALADRLRPAHAVYAGEHHPSPGSHRMQLQVLGAAYGLDHDVAVGVEMLPRRLQPQLDAFLGGSIDEEGFLAAVDWEHTWGFPYALYRPIFEFCRTHGLRIYALNAPRELPRAVNQRGIAGLTPDEQALLPSGHPWPTPDEHRRFIRQIFDGHPAAPGSDPAAREQAFERFYQAQLIWDESMAQAVAEILTGPRAPARLVVLAGVGHVGPYAIPARAARRGVAGSLTLAPVETAEEAAPTGAERVDLLGVTGPDPHHPPGPHGK